MSSTRTRTVVKTHQPCRLAILASHPVQYFVPIYRRLAKDPRIALDVLYCSDYGVRAQYDKQFDRKILWDVDLTADYPHRFLVNISPISDTFNPLHAINPSAFLHLLRGYDALWVNGYVYPSNWFAIAGAALRRTRILFRSELRVGPGHSSRWLDPFRERVIRWWVRRADALLYIGRANRDAYIHYGAQETQLFFSPYSVDVETISRRAADSDVRSRVRRQWGASESDRVVLFVGKMTERKHPEALLRLLDDDQGANRVRLVFVGTGPLESNLRLQVEPRWSGRVAFLGFVNQKDLPDIYAGADIFVMPSEREPWGLVLNEAMAAGLATVATDDVGGGIDLIKHGQTGFIFPSGDWDAMAGMVRDLVSNDELRRRVGQGASDVAREYSYDAAARGVTQALISLDLIGASEIDDAKSVK
jgi:glycosyltransferase involved in cell wall biosynthesis